MRKWRSSKELNPGDTLKVYEDGVAAKFVVAKHNYGKKT